MKKIVVFSGAGISAESGLATFRDSDGLWENHSIEEVATPEAWRKDDQLVNRFYNLRRKQLLQVQPNVAHKALVALESKFDVNIVTQNVDDLHERAGSSSVLHLHGELLKVRSTGDDAYIIPWPKWELRKQDCCPKGFQLRPHIVWFGEQVPNMIKAESIVQQADIIIVVGTSLNVYPAAGLIANSQAQIILVDPNHIANIQKDVRFIREKASTGIPRIVKQLLSST